LIPGLEKKLKSVEYWPSSLRFFDRTLRILLENNEKWHFWRKNDKFCMGWLFWWCVCMRTDAVSIYKWSNCAYVGKFGESGHFLVAERAKILPLDPTFDRLYPSKTLTSSRQEYVPPICRSWHVHASFGTSSEMKVVSLFEIYKISCHIIKWAN
jgi:hypothetical protein